MVGEGWYVDTQEPIVTSDSEPEPDVAIIRGRTEDYTESNPHATHVGLVVEVADATLLKDRRLKQRVYGRAGIPTYWVLNLVDRRVEVFTEPTGPSTSAGYATEVHVSEDESVAVVLDGNELGRVLVRDLLP